MLDRFHVHMLLGTAIAVKRMCTRTAMLTKYRVALALRGRMTDRMSFGTNTARLATKILTM